jgi:hypothetical protein
LIIKKTPATNVNKTKTQGLIGGRVCLMIVYVTDADFIKMFPKSGFEVKKFTLNVIVGCASFKRQLIIIK